MKLQYDDALPISARRDEIAEAIAAHQVVVVAGETGSGKTTQLPKIALGLGRTRIAHTQPRRIAARSVAARIAAEVGVELGSEVGYAVRFDDRSSSETAVRLVTDGLLLAEIHHDRDLRRYDTIIVDEAHERSLSIDFLLGYLQRLLPRRRDLKVVITSATIDVDRFAAMFASDAGPAPVIEVSGRTYPVEIRYRPLHESDAADLLEGIAGAIEELPRDGDVLIFLPGERDIRDAAEHLAGRRYPRTEILPLYGRLAAGDQQKIFSSHPGRRIVLATNVAETSLTVPGIRYVVDPGLARISRYSQRLKVQRLPIEPVSQASAAQRAGRCGRVADGICIRLYAEDDFAGRPEFTDPEIQRTHLAAVMLQMASLDLGDIRDFPFLDPPDSRAVADGIGLLTELGALAPGRRDGSPRLTRLGRSMAALPVDPRLGRMLLAAEKLDCLADVLVIVAAMSIQDPRERPLDRQQAADEKHARFRQPDSDFLSWLSLWTYLREQRDHLSHSAFRRTCQAEFLHYLRIREWQDVHAQLRRTAKEMGLTIGRPGADPDAVHRALLTGLLSQVGFRDPEGREFAGPRGARFMVFPGSGLAKKPPAWVMAAELVETTRLWARTVAKVQPEWIEEAGAHLVKRSYTEPRWSARRGSAVADERVTLYGLPLVTDRVVQLGRVDPALARELFIRHALVQGEWRTRHHFWAANAALLDEVVDVENRLRRRDLRVDDEVLFGFYDERVPAHVVSVRHFDAWWKQARRETPDLLTLDRETLDHGVGDVEEQFPTSWTSGDVSLPLAYAFEPGSAVDGLTVDVPVERLMSVDAADFAWHVPGHRVELVTELLRTLPKRLRRQFVPAAQHAPALVAAMDPAADDLTVELARQAQRITGTVVDPADFDLAAVPDHLRVTFRVVDGDVELGRDKDLAALRERLAPVVRAELERTAREEALTGLTSWDVGTLEESITVGQATGYPALIDEGTSVARRVLDTATQARVASVRGQARLLSFALPNPVPQIGRTLDLAAKLVLSTGPHRDAAEAVEECWLSALDTLVVRHGGPVRDAEAFDRLREAVRGDVYELTERTVLDLVATLRAYGELLPLPDTEAGHDVRVQLSWLVYPGFVRDAGTDQLRRLPLYLQAARKRLDAPTTDNVLRALELEAEFHRRTAALSPWARLAPEVQHVRWALEELRISLFAQHLRTAFPVSLKRVAALVDGLPER